MALKMKTTLDPLSVVVPAAYIRVEQVLCSRFATTADCLARAYESDPGMPPTKPAFKDIAFRVPFDPAAGDPYAQAYVGAKALPEFAGAVDC